MNQDRNSLFVDGNFVDAQSSARLPVINPSTEQTIGSIVDSVEADVDYAVSAAEKSLQSDAWSTLDPNERAKYIRALGDALNDRVEQMAELITSQNGMPISRSRVSSSLLCNDYYYYADLAESLQIEEIRTGGNGYAIVRREPVGVAALITPWNGPQSSLSRKLGPALAAGCTAVIKPAPETSLDAFLLAEAVQESEIPDGVINVITGGREAGAALVRHPGVRKVALTGSTNAGREVAHSCVDTMKRVTLELGGKSAAILLDDVDLEVFAPFVASACSPNTGQVCRALTRVLAPRSRYDDVVAVVADALSAVPMGDPWDPAVDFGPLASARQRERVEMYIAIGKSEGANVVVGGGRPSELPVGFYVKPTVFANVTNDMRIAREEIFGPVLVVIPYDDEEDALRIANDSEYGLGGGVFTRDPEHGTDIARRVQTGTIGVNIYGLSSNAPFGGVKNSGVGRELGPESVNAYLEYKTIYRGP